MQHKILLLLCFCRLSGASDSGIVAGRPSKPHSRPYMVSLQRNGGHWCGGALVRGDFVLTSAHCKEPEARTVVLGGHDIKKTEKSQQRIQVAKYHVHPEYTIGKWDNDVMLLELEKNATLNRFVKLIGLPKKNGEIPANTKCIVAGWGLPFPKALQASDFLMETTVIIKSLRECKKTWADFFNSKQMICTHSSGKKGGFCQGDSGGPVVCGKKAQAIATFTKMDECDDPNVPHVSMKIPYFVSWIHKVIKRD